MKKLTLASLLVTLALTTSAFASTIATCAPQNQDGTANLEAASSADQVKLIKTGKVLSLVGKGKFKAATAKLVKALKEDDRTTYETADGKISLLIISDSDMSGVRAGTLSLKNVDHDVTCLE